MKKIKVLNLYAGIGGNRKLLPEEITINGVLYKIEIVAIEKDENIALAYSYFFPDDRVIITDAHKYLLKNYYKFDFIWSSPPCPTHSKVRKVTEHQNKPVYPDLKLYEEILFLEGYYKGKWVVENVISWYDPLIKPYIIGNHYYWSNFVIPNKIDLQGRKHDGTIEELQKRKGFNLDNLKWLEDKKKILRNCVEPEFGLYIFNLAFKEPQRTLI